MTDNMGNFALLCLLAAMSLSYTVALPKYVVEVFFVVEKRVLDEYTAEAGDVRTGTANLKADIEYYLTEVNKIYASSVHGIVNIEIRQRELKILNTNIFPDSKVQSEDGLQRFDNWLANRRAHASLNYDLALLWTGSDIRSGDSGATAGFAHVGTVCNGKEASAIVEYDRTYSTVVATAHELAHNLGAEHDSQATGYVMAPVSDANSVNRWKLSLCSIDMIRGVLNTKSKNCLRTTNKSSRLPHGRVTKQLASADTICARSRDNSKSFMCKAPELYGHQPPQGDNVCRQLFCSQPEQPGYCASAFSSDGLICAYGKSCKKGKCQPDSSREAAAIDPSCLWGDQANVDFNTGSGEFKGTCSQFVAQQGKSICSQKAVSDACCHTCKKFNTGIPGCEFGDKSADCRQASRDQICPTNAQVCCEYCNGWTGKRSISRQVRTIADDTPVISNELTNKKATEPEPESQIPPEEVP